MNHTDKDLPSALIFGAGNVGRGFLGEIFTEAGLAVVFVDVDESLVADLNRDGSYTHITVGGPSAGTRNVAPVRALLANDSAVLDEFAKATIVATSVGARALPAVCRTLAAGLVRREQEGRPPLNVLLAENLHDAPRLVRDWVLEAEPDIPPNYLEQNVGLVGTSIGRMIPALKGAARTSVAAEAYRFLPLDHAAVRGSLPNVAAFVTDPEVPFEFYVERKLFIHNMGHTLCAYLGALSGDEYIWQAVGRPGIYTVTRAAMIESAVAIAARWNRPLGPLLNHVDDLLARFGNKSLADTTGRVGADADRKLTASDRFLGAARLCRNEGVEPRFIGLGIAAALLALEQQDQLESAQAWHILKGRDPELDLELIAKQYAALKGGFDPEQQLAIVGNDFSVSRIP